MEHYVDQGSGAWIFPPDPTKKLVAENAALKQLLSSLVNALPSEIVENIPEDHLRAIQDAN